jgi:hypothetical protein
VELSLIRISTQLLFPFVFMFAEAFAIDIPVGNYQEVGNPEASVTVSKSNGNTLIKGNIVTYKFNICEFEGTIKDGSDVLEFPPADGTCDLRVTRTKDGFNMESIEKADCTRFECGNTIDPSFVAVKEQCFEKRVSKKRTEFKKLFDKKKFAEAKSILEPIVQECDGFVGLDEFRWIANDLALAQFHIGDAKGCLKTLEPMQNLVDQLHSGSPEAGNGFAPKSVAKSRLRLFKAIETNMKLCKAQLKK